MVGCFMMLLKGSLKASRCYVFTILTILRKEKNVKKQKEAKKEVRKKEGVDGWF